MNLPNMQRRRVAIGRLLAVGAICAWYNSALAGSTYYEFSFDMREDGQHAVVLEYKLMSGEQVVIASIPAAATIGLYSEGVHHAGPRPTRLVLRWKDLVSAKEFSANAELDKLPSDLDNGTISFLVKEAHLSVYYISRSLRGASQPAIGPALYGNYSASLIYSN